MTTLEEIGIGFGSTALLAMVWRYIRPVISWLFGLIIVTEASNDDEAIRIIGAYLISHSSNFASAGKKMTGEFKTWIKPLETVGVVFYRRFSSSNTFFLWNNPRGRKIPIAVLNDANLFSDQSDSSKMTAYKFIRGTVNWKELTKLAADYYEECKESEKDTRSRFVIHHHAGHNGNPLVQRDGKGDGGTPALATTATGSDPKFLKREGSVPFHYLLEELGVEESPRPMDDLSLSPELEEVLEETRFWLDSKEWFEARGVPHRRGYAFEGVPGTGKTAFARALAQELDLPIHTFDVLSMDNAELRDHWKSMQGYAPCIALIEDIDGVFHGREPAKEGCGPTFDCLLNCINGIEKAHGILLIITTNHFEKVDPALGGPDPENLDPGPDDMPSRPQRIDRVIHFEGMGEEGRRKIARRILRDQLETMEDVVTRGAKDSAAQFTERCCRVAMRQRFEVYREARQGRGDLL